MSHEIKTSTDTNPAAIEPAKAESEKIGPIQAEKVRYSNVPFDRIYADFSVNFRMTESYEECEPMAKITADSKLNLYESIKAHGVETPLGLYKLPEDEAASLSAKLGRKVEYGILRGFRRFKAISNIRANNPAIQGFDKIPATVYDGLSKEDRFRLMADHAHIKGLNGYEVFVSIMSLARNTRLSEEQIAQRVNVSRGTVQRRKQLGSLPPIVAENFRKQFLRGEDGKAVPYVRFTDEQVKAMFNAQSDDLSNGRNDLPTFWKIWNEIAAGERPAAKPKAMTRDELKDKVNLFTDPLFRDILNAIAGDTNVNLGECHDALVMLRQKAASASVVSGDTEIAD